MYASTVRKKNVSSQWNCKCTNEENYCCQHPSSTACECAACSRLFPDAREGIKWGEMTRDLPSAWLLVASSRFSEHQQATTMQKERNKPSPTWPSWTSALLVILASLVLGCNDRKSPCSVNLLPAAVTMACYEGFRVQFSSELNWTGVNWVKTRNWF